MKKLAIKQMIIPFVIGLLVGCIITTGVFLVIRSKQRPNMRNFDPSTFEKSDFDSSKFPKRDGDGSNRPSRRSNNTQESNKTEDNTKVESGE